MVALPVAKPVAKPAPVAVTAPAPVVVAPVAKAKVEAAPTSVSAPIAKPVAAKTEIIALGDVGFGNALFIRGDGPGLSWEKSIALENKGSDRWSLVVPNATKPFAFKFLLNDQVWSEGENYSALPGGSVSIEPHFAV